jgi:hypothetical protein
MQHDQFSNTAPAPGRRADLLLWLGLYAMAMALVEAAIVVHLRHLYYPLDPREVFPLALLNDANLALELARELATVVMMVAVAVLAECGWGRRFAAFVFVFGVWDLGYYGWLKMFLDWPRHWLEWDVLFLIPWPWFGPWLAAALIAALFTLWGGWILTDARALRPRRADIAGFVAGTLVALSAFLAPAWPLLAGGEPAFRDWQPGAFLWAVYLPGLGGMALALWSAARHRPSGGEPLIQGSASPGRPL